MQKWFELHAVESAKNVADIGTKALDAATLNKHKDALGLVSEAALTSSRSSSSTAAAVNEINMENIADGILAALAKKLIQIVRD